jgi:hypothetical protein
MRGQRNEHLPDLNRLDQLLCGGELVKSLNSSSECQV